MLRPSRLSKTFRVHACLPHASGSAALRTDTTDVLARSLLTIWVLSAVVPLPGFVAEGIGANGGQRTPLGASIVWPEQSMQVNCVHACTGNCSRDGLQH